MHDCNLANLGTRARREASVRARPLEMTREQADACLSSASRLQEAFPAAAVRNSSRRRGALGSDGLQWEELEIVLLVKPSALEHFHRQPGPRSERQGIHHQLVYRVDLASLRLVVEKMDKAISRLQYVDVPRDRLLRLWQSDEKSFRLVVRNFLSSEINRNFA